MPNLIECRPAITRILLSEIEPFPVGDASKKQCIWIVLRLRLADKLADVSECGRLRESCQRVSEAVGVLKRQAKLLGALLGLGSADFLVVRRSQQDESERE